MQYVRWHKLCLFNRITTDGIMHPVVLFNITIIMHILLLLLYNLPHFENLKKRTTLNILYMFCVQPTISIEAK